MESMAAAVVVTGSGEGIGRAHGASLLGAMAAGAVVGVVDGLPINALNAEPISCRMFFDDPLHPFERSAAAESVAASSIGSGYRSRNSRTTVSGSRPIACAYARTNERRKMPVGHCDT